MKGKVPAFLIGLTVLVALGAYLMRMQPKQAEQPPSPAQSIESGKTEGFETQELEQGEEVPTETLEEAPSNPFRAFEQSPEAPNDKETQLKLQDFQKFLRQRAAEEGRQPIEAEDEEERKRIAQERIKGQLLDILKEKQAEQQAITE